MAITGTALVNGTMGGLLAFCRPGSLVVVLGPTTPLTPVWFDYGVDLVSASQVVDAPAYCAWYRKERFLPSCTVRACVF